ncbi:MAG: hypothetical protein H8E98_05550 [Bacteroidetes bacterium]|nr:hypothetical protein [Bacteroidota bacterium]
MEDIDYDTFMSKYKKDHEVCPECGYNLHTTTLVSYILDKSKSAEYKDLNRCKCFNCGNVHITHDRISIEEFKNKQK